MLVKTVHLMTVSPQYLWHFLQVLVACLLILCTQGHLIWSIKYKINQGPSYSMQYQGLVVQKQLSCWLTLKAPIKTAAEDIHKYVFIVFQRKGRGFT